MGNAAANLVVSTGEMVLQFDGLAEPPPLKIQAALPIGGDYKEALTVLLSKRKGAVAAAMALALLAAGCSGSSKDSAGGPAFTFGESTDFPTNLLPIISAGNATSTQNIEVRLLPYTYNQLPDFTVAWDKNILASEPTNELGADGVQKTTYEINPKAVWSDGKKITAKDYIYTANAQKSSDPATGGCAALISTNGYEQMASVEQGKDDHEVVVTYKSAFPDWKGMFSPVFPAHIMDKGDAKKNCDYITKGWPIKDGIDGEISAGPYQLLKKNIQAGKKVVVLTENPKWWGTKPVIKKIVYNNIGSTSDTVVKSIKNGDVNMVYPQPQLDLVKELQALSPDVKSTTTFGLSYEHLDMNVQNKHLKKPEVRQAIALGLDRGEIVSKTVGQFDNRAKIDNNRFWVNNQPEYSDNSGGKYDKPNVAEAQALLEKAGYTKGADGIYASPVDGPLELKISTTQGNPLRESTVDLMTQQLQAVGIKIDKFLDPDIFADATKPTSLEAGGFDMALFAWVSNPFISQTLPLYRSPVDGAPGQNYSRGSDPAVDALLDKLAVTVDPAQQKELTAQADQLLWNDMYTLPLYQKPTLLAYSSKYTGIEDNTTTFGPLWNSDTWKVQ